ncbi:MAG: imidazole glycerol phosphate synthase cyclase subunit [Akkermansiaceae bacterium]
MLKTRIIPTLLWKHPGLVKGVGFDSWRRVGTVLPAIKVYNMRDVDELIIVDITATKEDAEPEFEEIAEFTQESFVPMTVGGGVRELDHFKKLLRVGADKIAINSACYDTPDLVTQAANRFGAQCVVASIDAFKKGDSYECSSHSGTRPQDRDPVTWARELEKLGAGEILLTAIDQDGTMNGYDLELLRQVTEAVSIPVIASGGAGSYADMLSALKDGGASAIAAASIFHFTELTPLGAKEHLAASGIPVRLPS